MTAFTLALRRILRRQTALLLLLCPLLIVMAGRLPQAERPLYAGLTLLEESPVALRMAKELLAHDFLTVEDPETLFSMVERGELVCGVVLAEGLEARLDRGDVDSCMEFIVSPGSYAPELYKNLAAAALYREYAPYIAAEAFVGTDVTPDEVLAEYEKLFEAGYSFVFDVHTAEGLPAPVDIRQERLTMGSSALLFCALLLIMTAELFQRDYAPLLHRLGLRRALRQILLPGSAVCVLLSFLSLGCGVLLAGHPALLPAALIYCVLMCGFGLLMAALLPGARQAYLLLPLLLLGSAVLCPIYTDPAFFIPALETLRRFLPVYWFWLMGSRPLLWALAAVAAAALGVAAVLARAVWSERLR